VTVALSSPDSVVNYWLAEVGHLGLAPKTDSLRGLCACEGIDANGSPVIRRAGRLVGFVYSAAWDLPAEREAR
jgi:hypothetical protein